MLLGLLRFLRSVLCHIEKNNDDKKPSPLLHNHFIKEENTETRHNKKEKGNFRLILSVNK